MLTKVITRQKRRDRVVVVVEVVVTVESMEDGSLRRDVESNRVAERIKLRSFVSTPRQRVPLA